MIACRAVVSSRGGMAIDAGVLEGTLSMKGKGHVVDSYYTRDDSIQSISVVGQFNARSRDFIGNDCPDPR